VWLKYFSRFTIAATFDATRNYATIVNILTQIALLVNAFIGEITTFYGVA
jgi:hypothetical protein